MAAARARPVPTRSCVVCRTARPKRELLRVVRTPTGSIIVDPTGKVAGRGAYICENPACRDAAGKPGALSRALGMPVPPELRAALTGTIQSTSTEEA